MSNKYFCGKKPYFFCDICGQACYVRDATKLSAETGRGGLVVCLNDADKIDFGLVPYSPANEKAVPWIRINHQNITNGSDPIDLETSTQLGI